MAGSYRFRCSVVVLTVALTFVFASGARGDEIKLKDGSTLVGTIVGFEANSFKVKTSYGYAVVVREQVASITISDPPKAVDAAASANTNAGAPAAKPAKTDAPKPAPPPTPAPALAKASEKPATANVASNNAPAPAPTAPATVAPPP